MNCQRPFKLTSTHQNFNDKQKDLFKELDKVNVTLPQTGIPIATETKKRNATDTLEQPSLKHLRGRESIFKRPEIPLRRRLPISKVPDYQRNPHKWTKYSLDDVRDEDISEVGNKKAALTFLKELECRNSIKTHDTVHMPGDKITFQKSCFTANSDNEEKVLFKNSKVVMPEYVVGQKIKRQRKNKEKTVGHSKELILSHLTAEDDDP